MPYDKQGMPKGFEKRACKKIDETMPFVSGAAEWLHDANQYGKAEAMVCEYDSENRTIVFFHNGIPMAKEVLYGFIDNYTYRGVKPEDDNGVGKTGNGLKDMIVSLCDSSNPKGSDVEITCKYKTGDKETVYWHINKTEPEKGYYSYPKHGTFNTRTDGSYGMEIKITNCKAFNEKEFANAAEILAKSLSSDKIETVSSLQFFFDGTEYTHSLWDPMCFSELQDIIGKNKTIYNCEAKAYWSDDKMWIVRDSKSKYPGRKKPVTVRTISLYLLTSYNSSIEASLNDSGYYCMYGGCYIECGRNGNGSLTKHLGKIENDGGGGPRCRTCVIIDKDNDFLFNIPSAKLSGLTPFIMNVNLNQAKLIDGSGDLYKFLKESHMMLTNYHKGVAMDSKDKKYSNFDYVKNGFVDRKQALDDYTRFIERNKLKEDEANIYVCTPPEIACYSVTEKAKGIYRTYNSEESTWEVNVDYTKNEFSGLKFMNQEQVIEAVLMAMQKAGINAKDFKKAAKEIPGSVNEIYKNSLNINEPLNYGNEL